MKTQRLPNIKETARKILAIYNGKEPAPDEVLDSCEPCRAIAHHLGYEHLDGTAWWDKVMDLVATGEVK